MQRVLFVASGLHEASCRFRVLQYVPYLRARGWEVEVADLAARRRTLREGEPPAEPRGMLTRRRVLMSATEFDVVVVHRTWLSPGELRRLRRSGRRIVFDFDDAIMLRDSASRRFDSWQRRLRFARMVRGADVVVAGNTYLANWARRYAAPVAVIPTVVDLAEYAAAAAPAGATVVGWIGTRSNLMYLRPLAPVLRRLVARRPAVQVNVVSDEPLLLPGVEVVNKTWTRRDEVGDLRGFRIGVMPLPDDPWTRGKCGVKILQYFAARVPVVCSPVGVNLELVRDGESGYFARNEDEWLARLTALLDDDALCSRFTAAGRETVERGYCIEATIDRLQAILRDVAPRSCS